MRYNHNVMKKFGFSIMALAAIAATTFAQDAVLVRGQNTWRAGYAIKIKDLDDKGKLTLNAWALSKVDDVNLNNLSFNTLDRVYLGWGAHYTLYEKNGFAGGVAGGWSGNFSAFTQRVREGEWSIGVFARWKW